MNYMAIFWWLLALTILEVLAGIPQASPAYPQLLKGALLVGMAVAKAVLVALYFMHLKFEKVALGFIAMIPLVLCVFVVLMVLPDF
ncbi:MAG: cytochrome C oxidase subunit IV family protein [Nitrospinae bacterium]|nr:cytochrome C oxidase subunit IV family protein [Nitrospinota bacterium]